MSSPYQTPQPVAESLVRPTADAYRAPPKPVGPIIFGVLNILWGVFTAFGVLVSVFSLWMLGRGMGGPNPFGDQMASSPAYRMFNIGGIALGAVFAVVLLVAGVGMLKLAWWGRTLSIAYSVYALLSGLVGAVVNYFMLFQPMMQQANQGGGPQAAGAMMGAFFGVIGTCIGMIYPLALLIYCLRPATKQLFADQRALSAQETA